MTIRKVLLVEDYSSFHLNLRDGLLELGVDAKVASSGDRFKQYSRDIDIAYPSSGNAFKNYYNILKTYLPHRKSFINNDVVQFIMPRILYGNWSDVIFFNLIKIYNKKIFYAACANDAAYFEAYRNGVTEKYGYSIQQNMLKDFKITETSTVKIAWEEDDFKKKEKYYLNKFDGVIPALWDYFITYKSIKQKNLKPLIPLPINCKKLIYKENKIEGKIKIFHGVSAGREYFKGSYIILEALEKIKEQYPNDVEIIIVKDVSNKEYIEALANTNIFIDQANSYDLGMAALQGLALGKVVLTGAEHDAIVAKGLEKVPYFNIKPWVENICEVLEYLIENKQQIPEIGYQSRLFAEKTHGHIKIAEKYLKEWGS